MEETKEIKFVINGVMKLGKEKRLFKKEIKAKGEVDARERIYKFFGEKHHGLKRNQIKIEKIEKI